MNTGLITAAYTVLAPKSFPTNINPNIRKRIFKIRFMTDIRIGIKCIKTKASPYTLPITRFPETINILTATATKNDPTVIIPYSFTTSFLLSVSPITLHSFSIQENASDDLFYKTGRKKPLKMPISRDLQGFYNHFVLGIYFPI